MLKKMSSLVAVFIATVAVLGLNSTAFANGTGNPTSDAGFYIGGQAGYADTHWDNLSDIDSSISSTGFGGGAFAGYDFNKYLGIEGGYVYFPKATGSDGISIKTYGLDLLAKITVPVTDYFGLFAKAGPGYLNSSGSADTDTVNLAYSFGANFKLAPHLIAHAAFTRFNGSPKLNSDYQPDADLYALGLEYKFNL